MSDNNIVYLTLPALKLEKSCLYWSKPFISNTIWSTHAQDVRFFCNTHLINIYLFYSQIVRATSSAPLTGIRSVNKPPGNVRARYQLRDECATRVKMATTSSRPR